MTRIDGILILVICVINGEKKLVMSFGFIISMKKQHSKGLLVCRDYICSIFRDKSVSEKNKGGQGYILFPCMSVLLFIDV